MIRFVLALLLIAAGAALAYSSFTPSAGTSVPQPTPFCFGTDDEPPGCP